MALRGAIVWMTHPTAALHVHPLAWQLVIFTSVQYQDTINNYTTAVTACAVVYIT